jgi:acetylornithine deacetylase/succinyl-diaminopimelate desuccinylase-like protein
VAGAEPELRAGVTYDLPEYLCWHGRNTGILRYAQNDARFCPGVLLKICWFALVPSLLVCGALSAQTLDTSQRQLARDVFQQLIETDTTHSTGSTTKAAEEMRDRLLKAGFPAGDMEIVGPSAKRLNLVVRYRAAKTSELKPVLVIGHLDVVEARRADWTVDPFVFLERDGYFYGRGTQDMKDADAAFVTSFLILKKAGFVPKRDIILALTADEESGGENGVEWLLKNRRDLVGAASAINPDAGGLLTDDARPVEMDLEATEKVYADFQVSAANAGGHSSRPVPDNAIYAVADALGRLEKTPFPAELNPVTRAYLEARMKLETPDRRKLIAGVLGRPMNQQAAAALSIDPGYNAMLRTTCVATMMQAGHAVNALPGSAEANVNCRILPRHSAEEVRQRLVAIFHDARLKVEYKDNAGGLHATADERAAIVPPPLREDVMRPLREVTEAMWPGVPIVPEMESGASDSVYTMAAGIPSYGFSGMGIDEGDERAHGRDERIRVEAYFAGVEFTRRLVQALGTE